jgi:NADPH:quinone reductase-like Zn-dependent oxidoreductase
MTTRQATAVFATSYGEPEEALSVREIELPEPGPGQVSIEVRATAVNAIDVKAYSGVMGRDESKLPLKLGNEVAGVVSAVGPDATGPAGPLAVGDEVIGYPVSTAYATSVNARASSVYPKPSSLSWEEAAGLSLVGVTAVHLLEATRVGRGDTVLVHGAAGGVGLVACQLAVARGAAVVGTAAPSRHQLLRGFGVVPVEYGDGLADRVRTAAPQGVDVALDTVGTDEAVDVSLELVADRARIATIAAFARAGEAGIALLGSGPGPSSGREIRDRARLELTELAGKGALKVVVAASVPLTEAAAAHRLVKGGHAGGKVILLP